MNIIENDPDIGAYDDFGGPGIFVSLFFIAASIAVIGWGIVELLK